LASESSLLVATHSEAEGSDTRLWISGGRCNMS